ncbi:hypothetical protein OSH10_21780 [Kaistia defluvii]|uniref:hypothetical protein n=1 Tax=Kaistia defluvii TaxID=410841 RepID=UPI00225A23BB|nr:hypothetical protein [Kaistia defluvii]MCX5521077.1 hypothetical protein [Kaistia defluvii]
MADSNLKSSLSARTWKFGSNFAAGAMMLSRMNRSEISRYDDLIADLCCLHIQNGKRSDKPRRNDLARTGSKR